MENVSNFLRSSVTYQRVADAETDTDMVHENTPIREAMARNREAATRKLGTKMSLPSDST
jgi:hypothetical protein